MCVPLHVTKHFECCKITKPKKCAGAYTRLDRTNSIAQHRDPRIHTRKRLYQSANLPSKKAISNDGTTRYALLSRSLSRNVVCIEKTGSYSSVLYVNTRSLIKQNVHHIALLQSFITVHYSPRKLDHGVLGHNLFNIWTVKKHIFCINISMASQ